MRVAFIPAKGTSVGLPGKNLLTVGSKTLLERALELATRFGLFDKVVVSTESALVAQKVAEMMSAPGASDLPLSATKRVCKLNEIIEIHNRSSKVSGDYIKTADVVREYLDYARLTSGFLTLLQPTSPFRNSKELTMLLERQEQHPRNSIFSAKFLSSICQASKGITGLAMVLNSVEFSGISSLKIFN